MREIPVFFTIDNNYAPYLAVALRSAIAHSDPARRYRAIVLHEDLTRENAAKLQRLEKEHFRISLQSMQANFEALDDRMSNRLRCDYFTLTIYFRLFIPDLFPEYDKGIYIDSDVVLADDLAKLFDTEIGDDLIGACPDLSIADVPPLVAYTENAVGMGKGEYVNSGVLLMNLKQLRQEGLQEHFLSLLIRFRFDSIAPDQDYLNAMCRGRIHYLPSVWDAMPNDAKPPMKKPSLIHFNLFSKPWCYDNVQYEEYFWHHAKESGFLEEILETKAAYTEEQKAADKACMELLVERGGSIPEQEVTFRKMAEKGEKIKL